MALVDEITKTGINAQRITLEVRIAGRVQGNVLSVQASHGFDQVNSQATIGLYQKSPEAEEGAAVEVRAGYNGQTALIFKGELSGISWAHYPAGINYDARSVLGRVELRWAGGDYEYTSQDDAAVIRNILEKYGIPNTSANIESSGWTLGEIQPVALKNGDTGQSLIAAIDELAGYRTFTIATGVVLRRRISGKAGPSATWNFARSVNIISARRTRTLDGVVNHAVVRGLTYEDLEVVQEASAPNAYIPNPPGEAAAETQSDLVETDAKALEIARRIVADRNRRPERLELTVVGNPLIHPGATIQVDHADLGVSGARVFVENVSHSVSDQGFTTTIRTTGGNLSGYEPSAPIAQFVLSSYLEAEDTGTPPPTRRIVLIADGSGSFDPDGQTLTYAWTIAPDVGTSAPASGTEAVLRSVITGATTAITVTLVVTDADGLTGTASEVLAIDPATQLIENLWSAEGTIIACSTDGQQTWNSQTVPNGASATCLCPIGAAWGQLFGCSDGRLYASFDALSNPPVELGRPHGAVACTAVWIHETDASRLWAGFSDGQVWYGALDVAAKTATWALRGTVPASPVNELRESYGTFGELRATAGAHEWYSVDGGASWSVGLAGGTGAAAWRMAAGFERNAVALTAGSPSVAFEAGVAAPTLTPAPTGGIRALSMGYRAQELYAADGSNPARLYRSDADFAALAEVGSAAGLTQINHAIRSGNEDGIVYLAGGDGASGGGVIKTLRMAAPWYARRTGSRKVHMVAYGGGGQPTRIVDGQILWPTASVASGGIWHLQNGTWTLKRGSGAQALPTAATVFGVFADPFNPLRWIVLDYNGYGNNGKAYITTDAGVTFIEITASPTSPTSGYAPAGLPYDNRFFQTAAFSATVPGAFCITADSYNAGYLQHFPIVLRGSGTHLTHGAWSYNSDGANWRGGMNLVAGLSDDFIFAEYHPDHAAARLWRVPAGTATPTVLPGDVGYHSLLLDRLPGRSPALVGAHRSTDSGDPFDPQSGWRSADYRTTAPTIMISSQVGESVAATANRAFYAGRIGDNYYTLGITQVDDPLGAATTSIVPASSGMYVSYIRSDRQTQTAIVCRITGTTDNLLSTDGGDTWQRVPGPPGVSQTNLSTSIEVIGA